MLLFEAGQSINLEEKRLAEEAEEKYFQDSIDGAQEPVVEDLIIEAIESLYTYGWSAKKDAVLDDFVLHMLRTDMFFEREYSKAI